MTKMELIKELRKTGANLKQCQQAVESSDGSLTSAKNVLNTMLSKSESKKLTRNTQVGRIFSYIHSGGQIGVMIELRAETDFVTKNEEFEILGKNLCLQIAASENTGDLLMNEPFIKNPELTVQQLINTTMATTGELIEIKQISKFIVEKNYPCACGDHDATDKQI